jgi:sugar phosphate isomerase/epimerase
MTHRTVVAALLAAFSVATSIAQENNPAFESRLAARAAEKNLDWQISIAAYSFRQFTFFEAVDRVAGLGVDLIEGFNFQKISKQIPGTLNPLTMSDEEFKNVRRKLHDSRVTLIALYYGSFPADEAACRTIFEKSKKLGVKYFVGEPDPGRLPMLDKLAQEYGMIVGLHGHDKRSSPNTWHPKLVAMHCQAFSPAIGAFSDTGHWLRSELDPSEGVAILKDRIVGFEIHDLHAFNASGHDVPLGTGVGKL